MTHSNQVRQLVQVGVIAAFATLAFVGTLVIRIPIPATGGYFNLGDTFVMIAALLYGPVVGLVVGAMGPAMADAVGFPQFILATAVVKGIEGTLVGAISSPRLFGGGRGTPWSLFWSASLCWSSAIMCSKPSSTRPLPSGSPFSESRTGRRHWQSCCPICPKASSAL